MNKKILIAICVVAIVIVAVVGFVVLKPKPDIEILRASLRAYEWVKYQYICSCCWRPNIDLYNFSYRVYSETTNYSRGDYPSWKIIEKDTNYTFAFTIRPIIIYHEENYTLKHYKPNLELSIHFEYDTEKGEHRTLDIKLEYEEPEEPEFWSHPKWR